MFPCYTSLFQSFYVLICCVSSCWVLGGASLLSSLVDVSWFCWLRFPPPSLLLLWFVLVGLVPVSPAPPVPCGCCGEAQADLGGFTFHFYPPECRQISQRGLMRLGRLTWVGLLFLCFLCSFPLLEIFIIHFCPLLAVCLFFHCLISDPILSLLSVSYSCGYALTKL